MFVSNYYNFSLIALFVNRAKNFMIINPLKFHNRVSGSGNKHLFYLTETTN